MGLLNFVAALLASFLPARHWPRFEALPIDRAAPVAGILAFFAAGVLGVAGFMNYSDGVIRDTGRLQIAIAERQLRGELPETAEVSSGPMAVAMFAPLAFLLFTPIGQMVTYFGTTSFIRTLAWVAGEPMGDPVLTVLDRFFASGAAQARATHNRRTREQQEGAEVPDRRYAGAWARLENVDFVIVSSRRKPDWKKGTTVVAGDEWFSLGEPFELHTADGLRTVYPLTQQREGDVVRHCVTYEMPPLRSTRG